ncbi:MAG: type II toxin-antitoxin system ParD family antitoxin [Gammaproteobacteria bacterium]|nr:type II toxin-antitoxin system ParD family antitoxin [Gammaproteobacteria bacterium]
MSKNSNFNLGKHFNTFIDFQIKKGRYSTANEVIQAALRLLEKQEKKFDALITKLAASESQAENGNFSDYSLETLFDQLDREDVAR